MLLSTLVCGRIWVLDGQQGSPYGRFLVVAFRQFFTDDFRVVHRRTGPLAGTLSVTWAGINLGGSGWAGPARRQADRRHGRREWTDPRPGPLGSWASPGFS